MPKWVLPLIVVVLGLGIAGGLWLLRAVDEPIDRDAEAAALLSPVQDEVDGWAELERVGEGIPPADRERVINRLIELHSTYPEHQPTADLLSQLQAEDLQERVTEAIENKVALSVFLPEAQALAERSPDLLATRVLFGQVLLSTSQPQRAKDQFAAAVELAPSDPALRSLLGTILFGAGDLPAAVAAYRKATTLAPDAPAYAELLANALVKQGEIDEARVFYTAVLDADGSRHHAHAGLADVTLAEADALPGAVASDTPPTDELRSKLDAALLHMDDALDWGRDDPKADLLGYQRKRWSILIRLGRAGDAAAEIAQLPIEQRADSRVTSDLIALAERLDQPALAAIHFASLADAFPDAIALQAQAVRWHERANLVSAAIAYRQRLAELSPDHPLLRRAQPATAATQPGDLPDDPFAK
ncbi:MAG: tetratricopeptide repeat protein [Planctomycetota bacterium]